MDDAFRHRLGFWVASTLFVATVGQLLVGTFVPGIERYENKGFGYRLVLNSALMLLVPVAWTLSRRRRPSIGRVPWWPCALIVSSFCFDAVGNSLNLYDSWGAFDDISHVVTWFLLLWGIGLLLARASIHPRWALAAIVIGLGAVLAIVWEVGEWFTFIRRGIELDGAYQDTLLDQALGLSGAVLAAALVDRSRARPAADRA